MRYSIDIDNGIGQIFRKVYKATDVEVCRPHLSSIWPEAEPTGDSKPTPKSHEENADEEIVSPAYTGVPGRPTSIQIITAEFERRAAAGKRYSSKKEWSEALNVWFMKNYGSDWPPASPKTIENNLRKRLSGFLLKSPKTRPK